MLSMQVVHVLLLATTSPQRQPAAAQPAAPAPPDASEAEVSSPASLPLEILKSAERGEVQKVEKWLDEGGPINARYSTTTLTPTGQASGALLHAAAANNQVEMVTELLRRRASVDLQTCSDVTCGITALMSAASKGHLKILLLLLLHSADPNVQTSKGGTALLGAVGGRHEACVFALLRARANPELVDEYGKTVLQWAEYKGYTSIAALIRKHARPRKPTAAASAAPPDASEAEAEDPLDTELFKELLRREHAALDASEAELSSTRLSPPPHCPSRSSRRRREARCREW